MTSAARQKPDIPVDEGGTELVVGGVCPMGLSGGGIASFWLGLPGAVQEQTSIVVPGLAALTSEIARLVALLLRNDGEGQIASAQHHLRMSHDPAQRLVATSRAALTHFEAELPALRGRCLAKIHLDGAEREWLPLRPYAGNEVPESLSCELEGGHPEPHAANGQMGNKAEWWVHWTVQASEIVGHRRCRTERTKADQMDLNETDLCLLYAHHPGRHSFAIGEPLDGPG